MYKQKQLSHLKMASLSLALFGAASAHATTYDISGTFVMLDSGGGIVGTFPDLTGSWDDATPLSMSFLSPTPFFGLHWTAHDVAVYQAPGTYDIDACPGDGSNCGSDPNAVISMSLDAGQWGSHMLFDWGTLNPNVGTPSNINIDVVNAWDVVFSATGTINLTSTDDDGDGVRGVPMVDGAFVGFNANFDLILTPPFATAVAATQGGTPTSTADIGAGNITVDSGVVAAAAYDWSVNSSAEVLAGVVGGTTNQTLVFDPAAMTLGTSPTISVNVTVGADTVRGDITMSVLFALNAALDVDGDGTNDLAEGYADSKGNGIPDFISNDTVYSNLTEIQYDTSDNTGNSRILKSSAGTLSIGAAALANGNTMLINAGPGYVAADLVGAYTPSLTDTQLGVVDDKVLSGCIGGCVDFVVKNLTAGQVVNVVIPQTAPIPVHPVYKKLVGGNWRGFDVSENDVQSSAAATGTGYSQCPPPGDAAYTPGLTVGHECVQLTLQDGGPNDADGVADGRIVDPGGIGQLDLSAPSAGIGATWAMLLGLPLLIITRLFGRSRLI